MARRFNPPQAPAGGLAPAVAAWLRQVFAEIAEEMDNSSKRIASIESSSAEQEEQTVSPFTVVANPTGIARVPSNVLLATQTVLLRLAGNVVAHPLTTLFGDRLTYDSVAGTVSADDQTSALTASNGVTRNVDNFEEETQLAQSVKVNATDAVARPLPLPLGSHTALMNVGAGIVARSLQSFFADRLTYDESSGTVSADIQAVPDTAPGEDLGTPIDGATGAAAPRTPLEQGEAMRLNTVRSITLTVGGGAGAGGEYTSANSEMQMASNVTHVFVTLVGTGIVEIAGTSSDDQSGHCIAWTINAGSHNTASVRWLHSSVEEGTSANRYTTPTELGSAALVTLVNRFDVVVWNHFGGTWRVRGQVAYPFMASQREVLGDVIICRGADLGYEVRQLTTDDISGAFEALTANGGIVRELDNFRLADMFAVSIWANLTPGVAAPTNHTLDTQSLFGRPGSGSAGNLTFGTHQLCARFAGTSIEARSMLSLFGGQNISYNTGTEEVSASMTVRSNSVTSTNPQLTLADSSTIGWGHATGGGVTTATPSLVLGSVVPAHFANIPGNTVLANPTGVTGAVQTDLVNTHTFYGRKAGTLGDQSLSGLAGSNMTYDAGAGAFNVAAGSLIRVSTPADFSTSGTFVLQAATRRVLVRLKGGGGGGGGCSATADKGAGGGGEGSFVEFHREVSGGNSCTYAVGQGGAGGSTTPTAGADGGATTITVTGQFYSATGGEGGQHAQGVGGTGMGGQGREALGSTSGRYVSIRGQCGGNTPILNTDANTALQSGAGGGSGGGQARLHGATEGDGEDGEDGTGGGGSGAFEDGSSSGHSGGDGGNGSIVIMEFSI